ncbi:excisionase family DNA-binding protein [Nocardia sp. NPDC047654]|uniref:excisionase family DNA-binding protein n=1 Tax=Nocardia sp. NPDC047654 TaxID=3364314 RepID=UPI0037223BB1
MGDTKAAAAQLNCSVKTVRRMVADGSIPAVRVGRVYRIDLDALPGRERGGPQSGGLSPEAVASLVSEMVLAAEVLTEADASAIAGVLRQAWTASAR